MGLLPVRLWRLWRLLTELLRLLRPCWIVASGAFRERPEGARRCSRLRSEDELSRSGAAQRQAEAAADCGE